MKRPLLEAKSMSGEYPNYAFEHFYQQGLRCHRWGLPKPYIKQALKHCIKTYRHAKEPRLWQLKAFVLGCRGRAGIDTKRVAEGYLWPIKPDAGWVTLVCLYPDGKCDLDFAHPVSRRFWSDDNPAPQLPVGIHWTDLEELGFEIMAMTPTMGICFGTKPRHLKAVP